MLLSMYKMKTKVQCKTDRPPRKSVCPLLRVPSIRGEGSLGCGNDSKATEDFTENVEKKHKVVVLDE